jgi:hypothetical protein
VNAAEKRATDRRLYDEWKAMFPPPPYFSERQVRPWLLERAVERFQRGNLPDASEDEIIDSIMLKGDLELADELGWGVYLIRGALKPHPPPSHPDAPPR